MGFLQLLVHIFEGGLGWDCSHAFEVGKVVSAGNEKPPEGTRVIDALSRVVMPGIVAVDTDLAVVADDQYAVTPDALAIDGFDFELRLRDALEGARAPAASNWHLCACTEACGCQWEAT